MKELKRAAPQVNCGEMEGEEESVDQMLTLPESPCLANSSQDRCGPAAGLVEK